MDTPDSAPSALASIDTVAFKVGMRGYNVDEVDEFLERVSVEARALRDQLAQLRQQLRQAAERINQLESARAGAPAPAPGREAPTAAPAPVASAARGPEQVSSMIAMAQQFIEHAQSEAEQKARELTSVAQERAREIIVEARSRAEDEVNRLNGLKQRLSEDVERLSRQLDAERVRLAGVLGEFSRWIETAFHVDEPARAASAPASSAPPVASPSTAPAAAPRDASLGEPSANAGPATAPQRTIGQVLNFEPRDERA